MTAVSAKSARPVLAPSEATHNGGAHEGAVLARLLRVEGEARGAASLDELIALMANETAHLLSADQAFVARPGPQGLHIAGIAGVMDVDPMVPMVRHMAKQAAALAARPQASTVYVTPIAPVPTLDPAAERMGTPTTVPAVWMPLRGRNDRMFAAVLLLRQSGWQREDVVLAERLASTYAHAWHWHETGPRRPWQFDRRASLLGGLLALGLAAFPVSMATLAPMEVVARDPHVVTAPMDGVIEAIPIAASATVAPGTVLVQFVPTALRNRVQVAEREVAVAETRVRKTTVAAIGDIKARHELMVARSELAVKQTELDVARELLARTRIVSERAGLAVFGDKKDLLGKPIATGERIMDIADPAVVDVRIDVPVADAIILDSGKSARLYLDSAPLSPRTAKIVTADYLAQTRDGATASFRVMARFTDGEPPRLGTRGTAQLFGDRVPLAYYLLRRPIAATRQWIGL